MSSFAASGSVADAFFRGLVQSERRLLVLDYDGTLAPFAAQPQDATLYPGVAARLRTLQGQGTTLVFVSGRPARDLATRLPLDGIEIFGAHGHDHLSATGTYSQAPLTPEADAALQTLTAAVIRAGLESAMERKHGSLALHWRQADAPSRVILETLADRLAQDLPRPLETLDFDGGCEFRAQGRDKGTAIRELCRRCPGAAMAYLGDDRTDEDGFAALPATGLGVLVRPTARPTRAHLWIRPPEELYSFLDTWITVTQP